MRLLKIVSFSVAVLIFTVVFASVVAVPATAQSAQLALSVSNNNPAVGQSVTFTATLTSGTAALSGKSVTIYHYLNGDKYTDTTKTTGSDGKITLDQSFGSTGPRTYYATFSGDSSYPASTSNVLNVKVTGSQTTQLSLGANNPTPTVGQSVKFTTALTSGTTALSGKSVTIYHYLNGDKYTDTTKTTGSDGKITLDQSFGSTGPRTYYATFTGDDTYAASTSTVLTVNVGSSSKTTTTLSTNNPAPAVGQSVTFTATLTSGTAALSAKSVTIYHYLNGDKYTDTTKTTGSDGKITLDQSFGSTGPRTYYATFSGDSSSQPSTSGVLTVNVGSSSKTTTTLSTNNPAPAVGQSVTFTATLTSGTAASPPNPSPSTTTSMATSTPTPPRPPAPTARSP